MIVYGNNKPINSIKMLRKTLAIKYLSHYLINLNELDTPFNANITFLSLHYSLIIVSRSSDILFVLI